MSEIVTERTDHIMDPADPRTLHAALSVQGVTIFHHEEKLDKVSREIQELRGRQAGVQEELSTQMQQLVAQMNNFFTHQQTAPPVTSSTAENLPVNTPADDPGQAVSSPLRLALPERFSGDSSNCRAFLVQCDLHFQHNPAAFLSEHGKVAFIVSHLTGRAAAWATAEWSRDTELCYSLADFIETMRRIFDHSSPATEASRRLFQIRQLNRQVVDYAIEFRTAAADSGWNVPALRDAFMTGLSEPIKDQLAPLETPRDLESLIAVAIRIDNRLRERERERRRNRDVIPSFQNSPRRVAPPAEDFQLMLPDHQRTTLPNDSGEPMQLGRTRLSLEERQRRLREGCCFYCGQPGHQLASCPGKDRAHQSKGGRW